MICKRLKFTIKVNLTKVTYHHNAKNLNVLYEVSVIKDLARFTGQNLNIVLKKSFFQNCSEESFLKKVLASIMQNCN